jgi:SAM-dependent methyltransferase
MKPSPGISVEWDKNRHYIERRSALVGSVLEGYCSIYDLGCGNGDQARHLAGVPRLKGFSIVGHDPQYKDFTILRGHSVFLPYDYVLSLDVIEHVEDIEDYMLEVHSLLVDNGKFIVILPHRWWIFETHGCYLPFPEKWARVPFISWLPAWLHDKMARARIYTRKSAQKLLEDYEFRVLDMKLITAPLDVAGESWLGRTWRRVFKNHTTKIPFIATNIFIVAEKK